MLKYKVIKDFGSAKKGDVLVNSIDNPKVFTMQYSEEDSDNYAYYRSMSISEDIVNLYTKEGYLDLIDEEKAVNTVTKTVELIDKLLKQYSDDLDNTARDFENGNIKPCVKLETDTVLCNLIKVLNKVRKELIGDE